MSTSTSKYEPTLEERQEFFKQCKAHDWYYQYSDDGRVYDRGREASHRLQSKASTHPSLKEIYKSWSDYMFTGKTFGNEQAPKPIMPEV
jgi:hypothetical protein